jgi:ABC-type multidrug transport system fused ATPase/permease subunit
LDAPPKKDDVPAFEWPSTSPVPVETLEAAYNLLKDELKSEDDRAKIIESKLLSISSLIPIAMTVTVAMVTFLTSGRVSQFTFRSILIIGVVGAYIALQFLRASLAAITGLGRRSYGHIEVKEIAPKPKEKKEEYLQRTCAQMAEILVFNREAVNKKVDQLALGHDAIKNAVWGLLILLFVILVIVFVGAQP